jgi:cell division protein FtsB
MLDLHEVPGAVKVMLGALSLATTVALGTGAYAFTSLADQVKELEGQRIEVAVTQNELENLRETMLMLAAEVRELRKEMARW